MTPQVSHVVASAIAGALRDLACTHSVRHLSHVCHIFSCVTANHGAEADRQGLGGVPLSCLHTVYFTTDCCKIA